MRKLFIATLLLTIGCGTPAFAADCEGYTNSEQCSSTAGCYWEGIAAACNPCQANTYNDGTIRPGNHCDKCSDLSNYVDWIGTELGLTSEIECKFKKTCPPYTYFVDHTKENCTRCSALNNPLTNKYYYGTKTTEYEVTGTVVDSTSNFNDACAECGANSITNDDQGTGCRCIDGYHVNGGTNGDTNNNSTDCVPNQYTITYRANNGTNQTTTQNNVSYNSTVTTLGDQTFSKTGHTLTGWKNDALPLDVTPAGGTFMYKYTTDIELTAQWSGKSFNITYQIGDAGATCQPATPTSCTYGNRCYAPNIPSGCTYNGYVFKGWKCTHNCNNSDAIISPDTDINDISGGEDMTLTAQWTECPAGYYCPNIKTENKCPAGSTSAAKSAAITNCYMTGGTTKILDAAGNKFTLPGTEKIYYHGGNN